MLLKHIAYLRPGSIFIILMVLAPGVFWGALYPAHAGNIASDAMAVTRTHVVSDGDTLPEIARSYRLGYTELIAANPDIDPWIPPVGTEIVLPVRHLLPDAPREGIVVNLAEQRLYLYRPNGDILSMAIGIGRSAWETPTGSTAVTRKRKDPVWYPPASIRADNPDLPARVPAGVDNPLGQYALDLGWPRYLIHGTNKPYSIGRRATHGCIRLYPDDIEQLYEMVPVGTTVHVVDQPVKAAWIGRDLYLEVHPTQKQGDDIEENRIADPMADQALTSTLSKALGQRDVQTGTLDWPRIHEIAAEMRGIPTKVFTLPLAAQWNDPVIRTGR